MDIKIIREENSNDGILSVNITFSDIEENANNTLKKQRMQMAMPGFRKGMVPINLAKKMIWEKIISEELEKILETSIEDYFKNNEIELIRPVLPIIPEQPLDIKDFIGHEFRYHIGLIEPFEINNEEILKDVEKTVINITEEDMENEIHKIQHTYGEHLHPEVVPDNDHVKVYFEFIELDEKGAELENGLKKKVSWEMEELPSKFRKEITGKKSGEEVALKIHEVIEKTTDLSKILDIEKLTAEDLGSDFKVKILSIHEHKDAEMNEEFFKMVTHGRADTEEGFREDVKKMLEDVYVRNTITNLKEAIRTAMTEKIKVNLPEKFIGLLFNEEFKDAEKAENFNETEEKETFTKQIKWNIITNKIAKETSIEVTENEIVKEAYDYLFSYFYMTGRVPESNEFEKYVINYLQRPGTTAYMKERVLTQKVLDNIIENFSFKQVEMTISEFVEKQKSSKK